MAKHTFSREERLKKEKIIKELFEKGSSFFSYPFKIHFILDQPAGSVSQVMFSVSSRNIKKAVERNRVRRRMREAYRLQKDLLAVHPSVYIAFVYTQKSSLPYELIRTGIKKALVRISENQSARDKIS